MPGEQKSLRELIEGFERRGVIEYKDSLEEIAKFLEAECGDTYAPQFFRGLADHFLMAHRRIGELENKLQVETN